MCRGQVALFLRSPRFLFPSSYILSEKMKKRRKNLDVLDSYFKPVTDRIDFRDKCNYCCLSLLPKLGGRETIRFFIIHKEQNCVINDSVTQHVMCVYFVKDFFTKPVKN